MRPVHKNRIGTVLNFDRFRANVIRRKPEIESEISILK